MIPIKTPEELEIIKEAGKKLARVKTEVARYIKPGITLIELDNIADREIANQGAQAAFKKVCGYKWATCINLNDGVVHGIPGGQKIKEGDKVSVDVGIYYKGFNVDSAWSQGVPIVSRELSRFIKTGRETLEASIEQALPGKRIGHISQAMSKALRSGGCSPVFVFSGHGVGSELHEEPAIPCFFNGVVEDTPEIKTGMVLAIEAIYTVGNGKVKISEDGWTAVTVDGTMGGLFEETIIVTDDGPIVTTR